MTTTTAHTNYDSFLRSAQGFMTADGPFTREQVARRAADEDSCLLHASHGMWAEGVADGTIPSDTCSLCGGANRAGQGDHNLCVARAERGMPTPRLNGAVHPCSCYRCR
jgi:hypothetical protein